MVEANAVEPESLFEVESCDFQDNQGAIALAKNPIFHQRTKHIDIKYHFVREQVESKEFELVYVPTTMMQADFMTKNLPRPKFEKDIFAIGLVEDRQGKC